MSRLGDSSDLVSVPAEQICAFQNVLMQKDFGNLLFDPTVAPVTA